MYRIAATVIVLAAALGSGRSIAEPVLYATVGPSAGPLTAQAPHWRENAAFYLSGDTASGPGCVRLNNYWCVAQTFGDPWVGAATSDGRYAVFSDPRWAGRAAAYDLRARYGQGQRSARLLAQAYAPPCALPAAAPYAVVGPTSSSSDPIGALTDQATGFASTPAVAAPSPAPAPFGPPAPAFACPTVAPEALAWGTGRGIDDDLGLFDAAGDPTPALRLVLSNLGAAMSGGARPTGAIVDLAVESVSWASIAQDAAGFAVWRASRADRLTGVARFEAFLAREGVAGVMPTYQILRTGSDWRGCGAPFVVAPDSTWPNVVGPLRLIRDRIKPEFPNLEAMSGYRDAWQNLCMGGAESSAHRQFLALDLVPNAPIERYPLMRKLCVAYNGEGEARNMGLGFYRGVRFHVDTWKHRTWANENGQPLNVCNEEPPAATPGAPVPYNQLVGAGSPSGEPR